MYKTQNRRITVWVAILIVLLFGAWRNLLVHSQAVTSDLRINEFLAANSAGLIDEDGDYSDWIELYNAGSQPVNLGGWALTDDPEQPAKWPLPNLALGSRAYLVIFASGKDRKPAQAGAELHTNFRLNDEGEFLGLYNILDSHFIESESVQFPQQFSNLAYGRYGQADRFSYLNRPTPGRPNDETTVWQGRLEPVQVSPARGFYERPLTLTLTTITPGATIYYTLNGSEPGPTNGSIYTDPLPINGTTLVRAVAVQPGWLPSPVSTHSYIFLADVRRQPADPPGFPASWGVYTIDFAGHRAGEPVAADYEVDPEIANDPRYQDQIEAALRAIPSLSLVTDVQNFTLYANPRERGPGWERPVSVELIDPGRPGQGFQINAGVRIQGGAGRWEFMPKHSFRLFFKDEYGPTKLTYPLFPNSPVETFDTLVLRAGVDRSYAGHPEASNHRLATYTRDEWLRASQVEMSGVGSHGIFVHLYLNGLYWGLYNVVERPDASFAAAYMSGQKEDWYAANHRGGISGASDRFSRLIELAEADHLAEPETYAVVQDYLDITHFIDYMVLNWYAGTEDWPENNWYAVIENPAGQAKYFVWDGEESWQDGAKIHLGRDDLAGVPNTIKILFKALIKNPDFKTALADRLYKHLFHDGLLTGAAAQARWRQINAPLELAIIGESMRWGDARYEPPITQADWQAASDNVLAQMEGNAARLIELARQVDYYPPVDPPRFSQQGGLIEAGFQLTLTAAQPGRIYYTIDGSDPRRPVTGAVATTAKLYERPVVLTTTTLVKARLVNDDSGPVPVWSALNEATFTLRTAPPEVQLQISEIMYNPAGGNDYEFIELTNFGVAPIDLAGAYFEDGLRYTFPLDLPPAPAGARLVLVGNAAAFAERYPGLPVNGVYEGRLANQGEKITLRDLTGQILVSVSYDDEHNWPISPDGRGDSLVLVDPAGDPNDPKNWRASRELYGSPGEAE